MYAFVGWIVLWANSYEAEPGLEEGLVKQLEKFLTAERAGLPTAAYVIDDSNGRYCLLINGLANRKRDEAETLDRVLEHVARTMPGSYGLVYIHDDERQDGFSRNEFEVRLMRRGQITTVADPWFSPIIPTIEDAEPPVTPP